MELGADKDIIASHRVAVHEIESSKEIISPERILSILESDFNYGRPTSPGERGPSQEDLLFLKTATDGIQTVDGHYVLSLPFRDK